MRTRRRRISPQRHRGAKVSGMELDSGGERGVHLGLSDKAALTAPLAGTERNERRSIEHGSGRGISPQRPAV